MAAHSEERVIQRAGETARDATQGARPEPVMPGQASRVRLGVVTAVDGEVYTVGVLAANGTVSDTIPGVRVWGSATYEVDDKVTLMWVGSRPMPVIAAGGGGGGGGDTVYQTAITGFLGFIAE